MNSYSNKLKAIIKSKKAVSPVIAVILLIAIAVAASVTVFAYTQGILGSVTQAKVEVLDVTMLDGDTIFFTIRNTGGQSVTIDVDTSIIEYDGSERTLSTVRETSTGTIYYDASTDQDFVVPVGDSLTIDVTITDNVFAANQPVTITLYDTQNTQVFSGTYIL
ncbi:type IV pilin N-terminal domain-containing protein [Candidatus Borrarchaeum sp.]|uniref:type IV pilin N-terminal domain-containing protein n=1 Tax=Candidatus Borrarchaeum sp. TaxID=2846742 RepID=UPI00257B7AC8|nr:type IV pilin N-terminal domain-containing protein [Candidatus Borrarchaeum sp.]